MKRVTTYCHVIAAAILVVAGNVLSTSSVKGQDCGHNMLEITNDGSYVATPDAQSLHLTHGFTIECWDSLFSADVNAAVVGKGSFPFSYGLFADTSSVIAATIHRNASLSFVGPPIDFQHWHHYALTFQPNDSLRLYIDGEEIASRSTVGVLSLDSVGDSLRIGYTAKEGGNGNGITGAIDEVRIWNYARIHDSIRSSIRHIVHAGDSGLVLYYSFDDDVGSTRIHDFSGHAHDGVLRGGYAEVVPSTSPIIEASPGYRLIAKESKMIIPVKRCTTSFDTVINIGNIGTDSLTITDVGCEAPFSVTPHTPFTLPPDTTPYRQLRIHYAPVKDGPSQGTLTITSGSCSGNLRIELEASYDSVGLQFNPTQLTFDSVPQCHLPEARKVTVRNASQYYPVTIDSFAIPPGSGFSITPTPPIILGGGDSTQLSVNMSAGARGPVRLNLGFDLDKCSREVILNATGVRQFAAFGAPAAISLGNLPSTISGYTIDTFITVTNIGDVPDAIRSVTSLDTNIHIIDSRAGIFVFSGQSLNVPIRFNAQGCGVIQAKLHIVSTICSYDTVATVSLNLSPPLPLIAGAMDVGSTCKPLDDTFTVVNPNDQAVRLTSTSFSKDSVVFIDPTFIIPKTLAPHDSLKVPFRFFPMSPGEYSDTVYFHSLPCGIGTMVIKGAWGYKGLSFSQPVLDFGRGCNTDAITRSINLVNASSRSDTLFSESYSGASTFRVGIFPLPLILKPGESRTITFTYSPSLGVKDTGTFPLVSKDGCVVAELKLRGSRELAKASWVTSIGEFKTVCPGAYADQSFVLLNQGIDSIDILNTSLAGNGFTLLRSPKTIGTQDTFTIRFTPTADADYNGILTLVLDGCGTSISLPLHGSGGPLPQLVLADTTYDFGSVNAGDSERICIAVTNPSCTPVMVHMDSSLLSGSFSVVSDSVSSLQRGDTLLLCVQFKPSTHEESIGRLTLNSDKAGVRTILLHGTGLAPEVHFAPPMIDFGYVIHGFSKTSVVLDTNVGNAVAQIVAQHGDGQDFIVAPPVALAPGVASGDSVTFKPRPNTGLVYDTVYYLWDGHRDSVILRGFGTELGLQGSDTVMNFGKVHIKTDSLLPLYLFATNNFPTIDSITSPSTIGPYRISSKTLPYSIKDDKDSLTIEVTYHPTKEQVDVDSIVIHSGSNARTVQLRGKGVEAHPWISPGSGTITRVMIHTTAGLSPVTIGNNGEYPFHIDSVVLSDTVFSTAPISPERLIWKDTSLSVAISFSPTRARHYNDTAKFYTSATDTVLKVALDGTAIYPAGTGPTFGYKVEDRLQEEVGQYDTIPISMFGQRLNMIDADSANIDIKFDPYMVKIRGGDAGSLSQAAVRYTVGDSTAHFNIARSSFAADTVLRIYTEALLGPDPVSTISVVSSDPTDASTANVPGTFNVVDCWGPIHGVVQAGQYKTNSIVPNPAGDRAMLSFDLGFDGEVKVIVYNSVGQIAKRIATGILKAGSHTLTLDISDLPQGRYVYRLQSLEYQSDGALVIIR